MLREIELGYHRAWDVGKKGCLAVKVDGIWDSAVKGNKMRFFVMDGTDTGEPKKRGRRGRIVGIGVEVAVGRDNKDL